MCVCASEPTRPRLFNYASVALITIWVLAVSIVAHSVEVAPMSADANMQMVIDRLID
ncbi:MAG: hypothetical protein ACI82A_001004 [Candidatus Azotimanducaceae bacterium]|jgi:hypothetical protein